MGYKTSTLIAPADLREIFMPWQKRYWGSRLPLLNITKNENL